MLRIQQTQLILYTRRKIIYTVNSNSSNKNNTNDSWDLTEHSRQYDMNIQENNNNNLIQSVYLIITVKATIYFFSLLNKLRFDYHEIQKKVHWNNNWHQINKKTTIFWWNMLLVYLAISFVISELTSRWSDLKNRRDIWTGLTKLNHFTCEVVPKSSWRSVVQLSLRSSTMSNYLLNVEPIKWIWAR